MAWQRKHTYLLKYSTSRSVSSISVLSRSMSLGRNTSSKKNQPNKTHYCFESFFPWSCLVIYCPHQIIIWSSQHDYIIVFHCHVLRSGSKGTDGRAFDKIPWFIVLTRIMPKGHTFHRNAFICLFLPPGIFDLIDFEVQVEMTLRVKP